MLDINEDTHSASEYLLKWSMRPEELRRFRLRLRESQERFWGRFGVTQSSGSRFETGTPMPPSVAILLRLYTTGKLSDQLLEYCAQSPAQT